MLSLLLAFGLLPGAARAAGEPQVSARAAVVISADTGRVLWAKNENEPMSMASTTKIMTSLLTLESAEIDNKTVAITDAMVRVEGTSMGLAAGDKVTLKDLAVGMLLQSGNDAANSAALALAGTQEEFAKRMNARAEELGMKNSHFVTPSGLDDEQHYSTAYDMALLAAAAMKNPEFAAIAGAKTMRISFLNPQKTVSYSNHNKLLSMYEGCTGVKTGFTKKSGRCLVSAAERNGVRLVAVTLNDPNDWDDHKQLLDYGFSKLQTYPVDDSAVSLRLSVTGGTVGEVLVAGGKGEDALLCPGEESRVVRTVELPRFAYAPVASGQVVGHVRYTLEGKEIAVTDLVAQSDSLRLTPEKRGLQKAFDWLLGLFRLK